MPANRVSHRAAIAVLILLLLGALVTALVVVPSAASAAASPAPVAVHATGSADATEPFLPFSGPADSQDAVIPGAEGEQYLALLLAAVFFFIGLGYRMLGHISDVDRRE